MIVYVSGLPRDASIAEIRELVAPYGDATNVRLPKDRARPALGRGYGFITIPDDAVGLAAIAGLDGLAWRGQVLRVRIADVSGNRERHFPIRPGAGRY